ncbi:LOW QUALITY PROTEIN: hypothetical protein Q4I28_002822, partial [Leishmania naiffi]
MQVFLFLFCLACSRIGRLVTWMALAARKVEHKTHSVRRLVPPASRGAAALFTSSFMPTLCSLSLPSRHADSPPQLVLAFSPHLFSPYIWCDRFPARLRYPATPALLHFSHPRTTM